MVSIANAPVITAHGAADEHVRRLLRTAAALWVATHPEDRQADQCPRHSRMGYERIGLCEQAAYAAVEFIDQPGECQRPCR